MYFSLPLFPQLLLLNQLVHIYQQNRLQFQQFFFLEFYLFYTCSIFVYLSFVIRCHIIIAILLARSILDFKGSINFLFQLKKYFNLLSFFLLLPKQSTLESKLLSLILSLWFSSCRIYTQNDIHSELPWTMKQADILKNNEIAYFSN